jgi:hypothetical protein
MIDNNELLMASPNPLDPNVEEELRLRFSMPVRSVLCTPRNVNDVISKYVPKDNSAPAPPPAAAAPAAPAAGAAPAPAAAAAPAAAKPTGPMTEDEKKERFQYSLMGLGLSVIVLTNGLMYGMKMGIVSSIGIALVVGAAAFGIIWKTKSR